MGDSNASMLTTSYVSYFPYIPINEHDISLFLCPSLTHIVFVLHSHPCDMC